MTRTFRLWLAHIRHPDAPPLRDHLLGFASVLIVFLNLAVLWRITP